MAAVPSLSHLWAAPSLPRQKPGPQVVFQTFIPPPPGGCSIPGCRPGGRESWGPAAPSLLISGCLRSVQREAKNTDPESNSAGHYWGSPKNLASHQCESEPGMIIMGCQRSDNNNSRGHHLTSGPNPDFASWVCKGTPQAGVQAAKSGDQGFRISPEEQKRGRGNQYGTTGKLTRKWSCPCPGVHLAWSGPEESCCPDWPLWFWWEPHPHLEVPPEARITLCPNRWDWGSFSHGFQALPKAIHPLNVLMMPQSWLGL